MNVDDVHAAVMNLPGTRKEGAEWRFKCPAHYDKHPSACWNPSKDGGVWWCPVCNTSGGYLDLARRLGVNGHRPNWGRDQRMQCAYDYRDENGQLVFQVVRLHSPKGFKQRRPDGASGWIWDLTGVNPILYRLPALMLADPDEPVFVVEGEKDADNLAALGLVATTNPGGAGKWKPEYTSALAGRHVIILPDNDVAGRKHAEQVHAAVHTVAASVKVVAPPGLPEKGDVSDWLAAGHTGDELRAMAAVLTADLPSPRPHPAAYGAALLDDVRAFLARFVSYPHEDALIAHVLWCAHTHAMDAWDSTPRIAFLSPEPASGKTRALEVTSLLVPQPVEAVNVTPAYLFRKVGDDASPPTILFDEIDTVFGPRAKENEEIRGLLNAGHRRGATAGRCVVKGKTIVTEEIPAFCAVALAGLGGLPDTILSRSAVVRMRRRAPTEAVEPFRRRLHEEEGTRLRDRLGAWARPMTSALCGAWPEMPAGVADRNADVWEPLLAVADAAGGDWPNRARVAAVSFVSASREETPSLGLRLLADMRKVFGDREAVPTKEILAELHDIEDSPWGDLRGRPLDARGLAQLLGKYGIRRTTFREGQQTLKGYRRADCRDAWARYLPEVTGTPSPDSSETSETAETASEAEPPDRDSPGQWRMTL